MGSTENREFPDALCLSLASSVRYQVEEELAIVYVASGSGAVSHELPGAIKPKSTSE